LRALLGGPSQVDRLVLDLATNLDPFPPFRDARRNRQAG
jgi:hypothetical protein